MNPARLDANWFLQEISDKQARTRAQFTLMKVTMFVESPKEKELTETSGVFQWYESEEFEAYRALGYLMAWPAC